DEFEDDADVGPHTSALAGRNRLIAAAAVVIALAGGGALAAYYYGIPSALAAATGTLVINTNPPGAQVLVDGDARGATPLTLTLKAGAHVVEVRGGGEPRTIPLTITAGAQISQYIDLPKSVAATGAMQLYENKRLLGSSDMERLMVTAGKHEIEIVSEVLGYRATRTVQVPPGKVAPIKLEMPKGTIALNAIPWAEVWIDGEKV